jgi:hypothetical protein
VVFSDVQVKVAIAVFDIHADARTIEGIQELLKARLIVIGLQLSQGLDKVLCERCRIGRILLDGFPANGRRTGWGDKEVFLDCWWF